MYWPNWPFLAFLISRNGTWKKKNIAASTGHTSP